MTKNVQSVWLVIVVDCQSGYSCRQQDKHVMGGLHVMKCRQVLSKQAQCGNKPVFDC